MNPAGAPAEVAWLLAAALGVALAVAGVALALCVRARRRVQCLEQSLAEGSTLVGAAQPNPHTGLQSREEFDLKLETQAVTQVGGRQRLAVLFVDIDGFGRINDTLGHAAADAVLRELAARLHRATPDKLAATRMGGDEFVLLTRDTLAQASARAQRLLEALGRPLAADDGRTLSFAASIGIAAYPEHGAHTRLVANAHIATRAVKQTGGGAWAAFEPQMAVDQGAQARLLADLRDAIEHGQFELYYQPKVDARTQKITAAEALIRWHHPQHGLISPGVFIPLAERHGLIAEIGNWVIDEACRQAGLWRAEGLRMRVAINLSAYQMRQDDVVMRLQAALAAHRLRPERFTVEITESLALENTQATQRTFEALRRAGLHVSIDDFGAGQTSLAYLRQLPASELKMDMSLVRDLEHSADARAIAEAVIRLAHALERRVVAEGVETAAQRDCLVRMGCDELQGYYFAKPMTATGLGLWAMEDGESNHTPFSASLFGETTPAQL